MRVLFMMPVDIYVSWPFVNDPTRYHHTVPGCAFPQLAAMASDHDCRIFDGLAHSLRHGVNKNTFFEMIQSADLIGINVISEFAALNTEINIRIIREIAPNVKIVLGGYHATFFHERWCEKGADFVVRHEGEKTFQELVQCLEKRQPLTGIEGLTFKENGKIITNPERPFETNLDVFPMPNFHLLDYSLYRIKICPDGYAGCVEISRGCPHYCSFCWDGPMWKHTQRYKSVERIMQELLVVLSKGVKWVWFADNNFGSNYERDKALCENILSRNVRFSWGAFMRADTALHHPDLVHAASKAGLKHVCIGYEFLNKTSLEKTKKGMKGFSVGKYKQVYKTFHNEGISVIGLFLTGFPEEKNGNNFHTYHELCDFATWNSLRLQYKTSLYEDQIKAGNAVGDLFYHDRFMLYFNFTNAPKNAALKYNLRSLFNLKTLKILLAGKKHERLYILGVLSAMIKNILSISPNKLSDFALSINPLIPPGEKKGKLFSRYLNENFVREYVGSRK